jgi:hypothetical protein
LSFFMMATSVFTKSMGFISSVGALAPPPTPKPLPLPLPLNPAKALFFWFFCSLDLLYSFILYGVMLGAVRWKMSLTKALHIPPQLSHLARDIQCHMPPFQEHVSKHSRLFAVRLQTPQRSLPTALPCYVRSVSKSLKL